MMLQAGEVSHDKLSRLMNLTDFTNKSNVVVFVKFLIDDEIK